VIFRVGERGYQRGIFTRTISGSASGHTGQSRLCRTLADSQDSSYSGPSLLGLEETVAAPLRPA
jgi:hypothetical protein